MKTLHSIQRIGFHIGCIFRRPRRARFFIKGISRELHELHILP